MEYVAVLKNIPESIQKERVRRKTPDSKTSQSAFSTFSFPLGDCIGTRIPSDVRKCHGSTADPSHAEIEFYMMGGSTKAILFGCIKRLIGKKEAQLSIF